MKAMYFICGAAIFSVAPLQRAQATDAVAPLHAVVARNADSQFDENAGRWVIRDDTGLKVINIGTGEVEDIVDFPRGFQDHGRLDRLLTPDARIFAYRSQGGQRLTVARVADGSTIAELDATALLDEQLWPAGSYLADDGSYLICEAGRKEQRIVRIEFTPSVRVTASQALRQRARDTLHVWATGDSDGFVVAASAQPGGWFQVYNDQLQLLESRKLPGDTGILFAASSPLPLVLLDSITAPRWQLIVKRDKRFQLVSSGKHLPAMRNATILSGSVSPDGAYVVTSQTGKRPILSIWSAANGTLVREVHPEGDFEALNGVAFQKGPGYAFEHLRFSKSGRHLAAGDNNNAFLFDFRDIVGQTDDSRATAETP